MPRKRAVMSIQIEERTQLKSQDRLGTLQCFHFPSQDNQSNMPVAKSLCSTGEEACRNIRWLMGLTQTRSPVWQE